jgi:hypothetical protein
MPGGMASFAVWVTEEVVDHLPVWQKIWNAIQIDEFDQNANTPPAALIYGGSGTDLVYCFYREPLATWQNTLAYQTFDGTAWAPGESIPGVPWGYMGGPSATVFNDSLYAFVSCYMTDGPAYINYISSSTGASWTGALSQVGTSPTIPTGDPAAAAFNGLLYLFFQGAGATSGELVYMSSTDGWNWSAPAPTPNTGTQASASNWVGLCESPTALAFVPTSGVTAWQSANGSTWSAVNPLPPSSLYVFHRGYNNNTSDYDETTQQIYNNTNALWYNVMDTNGSWLGDRQIPGVIMQGTPSAFVYNGEMFVVYAGGTGYCGAAENGTTWYTASANGSSWCQPIQVSAVMLSNAPSLAVIGQQILCTMMGPGQDNQLWCASTGVGGGFGMMYCVNGGAFMSSGNSPGCAVFNGDLYCFSQGGDTSSPAGGSLAIGDPNGTLNYNVYSPSTAWGPAIQIPGGAPNGSIMSYSPAPIVYNNEFYVFFNGAGNNGVLSYVSSADGTNWSNLKEVSSMSISYTPSPVLYDGSLYVFHTAAKQAGQIWYYVMNASGVWSADTQVPSSTFPFYNGVCPPVAVAFNETIYLFYIGQHWQICYTKFLGNNTWGPSYTLNNTDMLGKDQNNQTTGYFSVVAYDDSNNSNTPTLGVYFQGYGNNGMLYCMTTTDPDTACNWGNSGAWSPTVQVGAVPPAGSSPPPGLANVSNLAIAVLMSPVLPPVWAA